MLSRLAAVFLPVDIPTLLKGYQINTQEAFSSETLLSDGDAAEDSKELG